MDPDQARQQAVADALASLPTALMVASPETEESIKYQVEQYAGSAFDACLEVALREEKEGSCDGEPSETAVQDAETRYVAGPGIAVNRFGECLNEISCDASCPTEEDFLEALSLYVKRLEVALSAYGVQSNPNITLATQHVSGKVDAANPAANVQEMVEGKPADRSHYGNAPGGSSEYTKEVLDALNTLSNTYTFRISEMVGGSHSRGSNHYKGNAFDVDLINGKVANANNKDSSKFMKSCTALGATEVLGPGDAGHDTHVHAAWE